MTSVFDDLVEAAGITLAGAPRKLRSPRLRGRGDPPGTGVEPDCAFYVGERARGYCAAQTEGEDAVYAYAYLRHEFSALPKAQSLAEVEALLPTRLDRAAMAPDSLQVSFLAACQ